MKQYIVSTKSEMFQIYKEDIYKLRHKVFKETLNWSVETVDGNKEIDDFDKISDLHYILVISHQKKLIGCMRLLPTQKNYMLEKVFPMLMENLPIPKEEKIWELSRFAIDPQFQKEANMLTFNKATLLLIKGICEFSKMKKIQSYVAVTTDRMDRLVKKLKMDAHTIGKRVKIENTNVIALQVNMNEKSYRAVDEALIGQ